MPAYDLRIFKSWGARNLNASWVNTYVVESDAVIGEQAIIDPIIDAFVSLERDLHLNQVQFLHATFSTTRDEPVYDPRTLYVRELAGVGGHPVPENEMPLDLNIALKMKKQVAFGRAGTMFYRGCLTDNDVMINSRGESELNTATSRLNNPAAISNAWVHVGNLDSANWIMRAPALDKGSEEPIEVRIVTGIAVGGISVNKRNHKYFDEFPARIRRAVRQAIAIGGSVQFDPPFSPPDELPQLPAG